MSLSLPKSLAPGRCILFLICLSLTVVLSTSSSEPGVEPLHNQGAQFVPRQIPTSSILPSPSSTPESRTPTTTTTSTTNAPTHTSNTPNENTSTTSTTSQTSAAPKQDSTTTPSQSAPSPPPAQLSSIQSTGADGSPTIIVVTVQASSSTTTSPTPTDTPKDDPSESSGLSTGSIVGLSVAGGIALLGIAAFFVWKFTRKRWSATYDDGKRCDDVVPVIRFIYNGPPQARSSGQTSIVKATLLDRMTIPPLRPFLTVPRFMTKASEVHTATAGWALLSLRSIYTLQTRMQSHHFPISTQINHTVTTRTLVHTATTSTRLLSMRAARARRASGEKRFR